MADHRPATSAWSGTRATLAASKARITLDARGAVVVDDGRGHEGAPDFGLRSLRDRARGLGGEVIRQPHGGIDGGFRLELILPEVDDD